MKLTRATAAECEAMAAAHRQAFHDKAWRDDEFEDLLEGEGIYGFLADDGNDEVHYGTDSALGLSSAGGLNAVLAAPPHAISPGLAGVR